MDYGNVGHLSERGQVADVLDDHARERASLQHPADLSPPVQIGQPQLVLQPTPGGDCQSLQVQVELAAGLLAQCLVERRQPRVVAMKGSWLEDVEILRRQLPSQRVGTQATDKFILDRSSTIFCNSKAVWP